jgi:hypothetical protein
LRRPARAFVVAAVVGREDASWVQNLADDIRVRVTWAT